MANKRGLPVPANPTPEQKFGRLICIPDDPQYFAAVMGVLKSLTQKWYWDGTPEQVQATTDRMWQMYFEYQNQDGGCSVDCETVQDCIEDNEATRAAIQAAAQGGSAPAGVPLSFTARNANLADGLNPTCDLDILWAECRGIVQFSNRLVEDYFQAFETLTNKVEVAGAVAKAPALDEIGFDAIADFASMAQDSIQENYLEDYTETYEIELACAIFCAAQSDCVITIDRIYDILLQRVQTQVGGLFTWDNLIDMLNDIVSFDIDVVNCADAVLLMAFGAVRLANFLINIQVGYQAFARALAAFDEGSNDWEVYCTECGEGCPFYDFSSDSGEPEVYPSVYTGVDLSYYNPASGWESVAFGGSYANQIVLPLVPSCPTINLAWYQPAPQSVYWIGWFRNVDLSFELIENLANGTGELSQSVTVNYGSKPVWADSLLILLNGPSGGVIIRQAEYTA